MSLEGAQKMMSRLSIVIVTLIISSVFTPLATTRAEGGTTIQVVPSIITMKAGETFTVDVTITDVTDLAEWELGLFYLNTVLNCTNITEGPFLKMGGYTFFTLLVLNAYNTTHGRLLTGSTLLGQTAGVNGSGTLATITFLATAPGATLLQFSNDPQITFLKDSNPPPRHSIPFTTISGTVDVISDHDVAVTSITSYKTNIGQNYCGRIDIIISNQGGSTETFNMTTYANAIAVETREVTVVNGSSATIAVIWNTTDFAYGNYTIGVYAQPVLGETNTQNNNLTSPLFVMVTMAGDLMPSFGVIDMKDVAFVAKRFDTDSSNPVWDPNADIDDSGRVDMKDVAIVAKYFGKHYQ